MTQPNPKTATQRTKWLRKAVTGCSRWLVIGLLLLSASILAAEPAAGPAPWENISDEFFKSIGVYDLKLEYSRRCVGLGVTPTGEVFIVVPEKGICVSKDHGKTWTEIPGNKISGRGEFGFFSIAYPYNGRIAVFTIDGKGGVTTDSGVTWRTWGPHHRGFDFGDLDWSTPEPKIIYARSHEPTYRVLSTDGGATWTRLDANESETVSVGYRLGVVNATTLVQALGPTARSGIFLSTDQGKTWGEVSKFTPNAPQPVHYGCRIYWAASDGIIVSTNGKDWGLFGSELKDATFGPYFGTNEKEMMVVTPKGFFITRDGAKTWKNEAPFFSAPDSFSRGKFMPNCQFTYFGWDPMNNIIYASGLGGSCFRLSLKP